VSCRTADRRRSRRELSELHGVHEEVLLLKDLSIEGSRVAPHTADDWLNGKEGELVLVNGRRRPRITLPGGVSRLRVINACNARALLLHLEGHELTVLGAGIGFAEEAVGVESLLLAPGERADLLVTLRRTGDVPLVALPYDRGADMSGMDPMAGVSGMHQTADMGGMDHMGDTSAGADPAAHHGGGGRLGNTEAITLATLAGSELSPAPRLPDRLAALPSYDPHDARRRRQIVLSEEMGVGPVRFLLNGGAYEAGRIDFRSELGSGSLTPIGPTSPTRRSAGRSPGSSRSARRRGGARRAGAARARRTTRTRPAGR
jgi:FtsP/CotA-like multicopper oxidase with cupredoxin domain